MGKIIKLIMVTGDNNNKFYNMTENEDGTFKAGWGRINSTSDSTNYPMSKWNSIYKQKTGKGYKDVTSLYAIQTDSVSFASITNSQISILVNQLQSYANKSVTTNYTISSENVTQAQIDTAQTLIDNLTKINFKDKKELNKTLIEIYTTIPRKMNNTKYHLFGGELGIKITKENVDKLITNEQSTLDVMRGQVSTNSKTKKNIDSSKTILDAMGIIITDIDDEDKRTILKLLGANSSQFRKAYKVIQNNTENKFVNFVSDVEDKSTYLFWHGSRNENWWSILDSGLVLRPANAIISGKMFGYGIYFADKAQKSIGYTSLRGSYWASGNANVAYLALFKVHTGKWLHIKNHQSWMYDLNESKLKSRGDYNSLFAEGGYDLRNNEYIVYNQNQCTINYLVEIGG